MLTVGAAKAGSATNGSAIDNSRIRVNTDTFVVKCSL